jgi:hypothetical protein
MIVLPSEVGHFVGQDGILRADCQSAPAGVVSPETRLRATELDRRTPDDGFFLTFSGAGLVTFGALNALFNRPGHSFSPASRR